MGRYVDRGIIAVLFFLCTITITYAGPFQAPYAAQRASVTNWDRDAILSVWLYDGQVHAYFDLLQSAWKFYCGPAGWTSGGVRAVRILNPDGTEFTAGEFNTSREFIVEFPVSIDTSEPLSVTFNSDQIRHFDLVPLTEDELKVFDPVVEDGIKAVVERYVIDHTSHLYRYFDLKTNEETGATAWFYESKVPPSYIMENFGDRFRFEESEGLVFDREYFRDLKPWITEPLEVNGLNVK